MKQMAIKTIKRTGHAILDLAAILLVLVILVHVSLAVAAVWLNTPSGQDMLRRNIDTALAESGYTLHFKSLSYNPLDGVVVTNLNMGDGAGPILSADQLSVRISLLSFAARQGALNVRGGHVTLYRLPEGTDTPEQAEQSGFTVPDIFLTSVVIERLSIARLEIQDAVMGQAMILSPDLRAKAILSPSLSLSLDGRIAQLSEAPLAWMPENISVAVGFDPETLLADITALSIKAPSYHVQGAGHANLQEGGDVDVTLNAAIDDLKALAGDAGRVQMDVKVTGSSADPVIAATGNAVLERFEAEGLPALDFKLDAAALRTAPAGTFSLSGAYKEQPLSLSSAFVYAAPELSLSDIALTGPDATASGALVLNTQSLLVQGKIQLDAKNLKTYAPLVGVDVGGAVLADLILSVGEGATQSAALTLDLRNGEYETYRIESAKLVISLADVKDPWPQTLDLILSNAILTDSVKIKSATANLKKAAGQDYRLTLDAKGDVPQAVSLRGGVTLSGIAGVKPAAPVLNDIDVSAQIGSSAVTLTGRTDFVTVDIVAATQKLALSDLPGTLPDNMKGATLSGSATLKGALAKPEITLSLKSSVLKLADPAPAILIAMDAFYRDGVVHADLKGSGDGIRTLSGSGDVPLSLSLSPFVFDLPQSTPLSAVMAFDLDGGVLSRSILPPDHEFSGALRGDAKIAGTMAKPDIAGQVQLKDGVYQYDPLDLALRDMIMTADLSPSGVEIKTFSARDGEKGTLDGQGHVDFADNSKTNATLNIQNFHLLRSDKAEGYASAALSVTGRKTGYQIGGTVDLGEINVTIPEQFQTNIPQLNIIEPDAEQAESQLLQSIDLDVKVHAPGRIFVRGWGLDAEFGGDLEVSGTLAGPLVNGSFESIRGRYEEFGKRFALDHAKLRFQGTVPPSPYLDIKATTTAGDVQASVLLSGPVVKPSIAFASVPALPEDEVMSRILFGKTMSGITPFQAIQLTQTLQRFSGNGGGGFDPLGTLRDATGLDDIRVDSEEGGDTSVGVGKYLTEKVYLEVEKGAGATSGAATIEIELTPSIKVDSKIGQDAQGGAGIFWSRDY